MSHNNPSAPRLDQPLYQPDPRQAQSYSDYPPPAPASAPEAERGSNGKVSVQGWRDLAWAVLFLLHLMGYIGAGSSLVFKYRSELTVATTNNSMLSVLT